METQWESEIVPTLSTYIEIPNISPMFDKEWETNGLVDKVVALFTAWIDKCGVAGLTYRVRNTAPHNLLTPPGRKGARKDSFDLW